MLKRINDMQTMKSLAIILGFVLITHTAWAIHPSQTQKTFSNASLKGTYSYYNAVGDVGSWGLITFDGDNEWTIDITVNVSDGAGGRMNIDVPPATGTYVVNSDGTGVATVEPAGFDEVNFDFVFSQVRGRRATEVSAVIREGGVEGQLAAPVWKKISNE